MWRTKFLVVTFIGLLGIVAVVVSLVTWNGDGHGYPVRPVTVVVPFPAGGPSDVVARVVTEQMGNILGQSLVIENVGGGGGTIGSARVAAAHPDGYTLLAGSMGSHVSAPVTHGWSDTHRAPRSGTTKDSHCSAMRSEAAGPRTAPPRIG